MAFEIPFQIAVPVAAPPGIPVDRAKALQDAFIAAQKDADYLAQAAKLNLPLSPINGDEISSLVDSLYALPADAVACLKTLHAEGGVP